MRHAYLPSPTTPFVGRAAELVVLTQMLLRPYVRLLTLTGPGGVGKTRLAIEVASLLRDHFADGVYFVPLDPLRDPQLVLDTIARRLDLKPIGSQSALQALIDHLYDKRVLVIADNFEQVLAAAPPLNELLAECQRLKLLVTSREKLHLRGEYEYPVPPLLLPDPDAHLSLSALTRVESVELFVERATANHPVFALTPQNAQAVAKLCLHLDGLPLAIELAAARVKLLTPEAMVQRLQTRFSLLTGGIDDLPARQRTLRNAIGWSYELLSESEQLSFRRLAIFTGGWTLEAAEVLLSHGSGDSILDRMELLLNKSLILRVETTGEVLRFRMLETIREFGIEQLSLHGELQPMRAKHAAYFTRLAAEAEPHLIGRDQDLWLEYLDNDHDNLRSALRGLLDREQHGEAIELAGHLWRFWLQHAYLSEGLNWLEDVLAYGTAANVQGRAKVLSGAGIISNYHGNYRRGETFLQQAVQEYRTLNDQRGLAVALNGLAHCTGVQGDYTRAIVMCSETIAISREIGDAWSVANSLWYRGNMLWMNGQNEAARRDFEESLILQEQLGNTLGAAYNRLNLAFVEVDAGNYSLAERLIEQVYAGFEHDKRGVTRLIYYQGLLAFLRRAFGSSLAYYQDSLRMLTELGDSFWIANLLDAIAGISAHAGSPLLAARLFGASEALREHIYAPIMPRARPQYESHVSLAETKVSKSEFAEAWALGRTLSEHQAVALALGASITPLPNSALTGDPATQIGLTTREREVLRLLAEGLTDQQIAERLVISRRTVHTHLNSIYGKLGVSTRAAATRYALDHHLIS